MMSAWSRGKGCAGGLVRISRSLSFIIELWEAAWALAREGWGACVVGGGGDSGREGCMKLGTTKLKKRVDSLGLE